MDEPSAILLEQWRKGEQQAATVLFDRYAERLIALAASRLPERLTPLVGAEDVVQSVFKSFFDAAGKGRYLLQDQGDLWRLLVAITRHKLCDQVNRQAAQKRGGLQTGPFGLLVDPLTADPSPSEAAVLTEELQQLMNGLATQQRLILELWLQGKKWDDIAEVIGCSQRTVRRVLEKIETQLEQRLPRHPAS
jgi:RNA polymerase sigma factor (sigma-70 family)